MLGIEELSKVVKNGAKVATGIANKSGVFSLLGSLLEFSTVNWSKIGEEVKDLSVDEIDSLQNTLSAGFSPDDKALDLKFDELLALGEKSFLIGQKAVKDGMDAFDAAKEIVAEWQSFFAKKVA